MAGDLLHYWNEPAELLNMAADAMPQVWAVAGNHDLPNHSMEQVGRSAFTTLAIMGRVRRLGTTATSHPGLLTTGYDCGVPPSPAKTEYTFDGVRLAVVHRYVWVPGMGYPGCKKEDHAGAVMASMSGYDVILTGDNHTPFQYGPGQLLFNAGCLIRRRADERHLEPRVGILYSDGTVTSVPLDTSADKWRDDLDDIERAVAAVPNLTVDELLDTLGTLADVVLHFGTAVRQYLDQKKIPAAVAERVVKIVEEHAK